MVDSIAQVLLQVNYLSQWVYAILRSRFAITRSRFAIPTERFAIAFAEIANKIDKKTEEQ